jgi:hypothetical protein
MKITKKEVLTPKVRGGIFPQYSSDANFVTAKGESAAEGDVYWNSTLKTPRKYDTAWGDIFNPIIIPQGRLTLTSSTPYTTSDTTNTSIYYTRHDGDTVCLYNSTYTQFVKYKLIGDIAYTPSGVAAGTNIDIFIYDNAGTLTLSGTAWTNDTTRATALSVVYGVLTKSGASGYLYLGTVRTSATDTIADTVSQRFVYNYYNKLPRELYFSNASSHTYTTEANRFWNNSSSSKVELVNGVRDGIYDAFSQMRGDTASSAANILGGLGVNSSTVISGISTPSVVEIGNRIGNLFGISKGITPLGYSYFSVVEYGCANLTFTSCGLYVTVNM